MIVSTTQEVAGHRVMKTIGIAQGYVTKTQKGGGFLSTHLAGGHDIQALQDAALEMLKRHTSGLGGNAVICARYETTALDNGFLTLILYGTAVVVEPYGEGE